MEIGIVRPLSITDGMRTAYLDYAMSVIVSRALPDARDGLKPVQRRILYAMMREGLRYNQGYSKCAGVVGEVLKKYHPHGDQSVYDALVRLAQPWNMRYPLVDGQGNFGCFTGNTKIKLLDGTERTFAELSQLAPDETFYVYSVDANGRIVVGEGRSSRITRRAAQIIEVTFDDGTTVRCTPDHRFMLRDGSWREAQQLTIDDSLMAGYFDTAPIKASTNDYLRVLQPASGEYEFVHHLADAYNARPCRAPVMRDLTERAQTALRHKWSDTDYARQVMRAKIAGYAARLLAEFGREQVTPDVYDARRTANWIPSSKKALAYFASFDELLNVAATHNHRAVQVRWLDERVDVYDITVDEHHNFMLANGCIVHNSVDGDSAAAYRYTEARLTQIAEELLLDIEKNTVDMMPNFDGKHEEPKVLPARLPNLLLNGASGIAVGMATNIPPHNISELCDAIMLLIDNPEVTVEELLKVIPGPDFPTGGLILGTEGIISAYSTGRGHITLRAKAHIEEAARSAYYIVVTELPYQVNKARLQERMAELAKERKIEGIRDVRDESDRTGMRLVIILKQDAQPKKVLNALFKHTQMQTTFGTNMLALVEGGLQPRVLTLKRMLQEHIDHRREVIRRRTEYDLDKARARAHILEGLKIALDNLDAIITTIRNSRSRDSARNNLISNFTFTEIQANAILEMQLGRLAALERKKIEDEYNEVLQLIGELEDILGNPRRVLTMIKEDLAYLKEKYGDGRRTRILPEANGEMSDEDLIPDVRVLVTLTDRGYIKRQMPDAYRTQLRGGRGIKGAPTREQDVVRHILACSTMDDLLFFTDRGKVYQLKTHELPDATRTAKGLPLVNLISLEPGEQVTSVLAVPDFDDGEYLVMATRRGKIKRTLLKEYSQVRSNGLIAIGLEENDQLGWVGMSHGTEDILITTRRGQTSRFKQSDVRPMGRPASGVIGINLTTTDEAVGMDIVKPGGSLLVITANGYGKRTDLEEYPAKGRGTGGVITIKLRSSSDHIAAAQVVYNTSLLTFITKSGIVMRTRADGISQLGRLTQGVTILNLDKHDHVASLACEEIDGDDERSERVLVSMNGSDM